MVWWVGLQCLIVVFLDHTHCPSNYFLHTHPYFYLRFSKSGIGVIRGGGGYYAIPRT